MKINFTFTDGITFCEAATLMFLGLKLTGHINWPMWKVFLPFFVEAILQIRIILKNNPYD